MATAMEHEQKYGEKFDELMRYARTATQLKHSSENALEPMIRAAMKSKDPIAYIHHREEQMFGPQPGKESAKLPAQEEPKKGKMAVCPTNPKHTGAEVYKTSGRTRHCRCNDCGETWKFIGPPAKEKEKESQPEPEPQSQGSPETGAAAKDPPPEPVKRRGPGRPPKSSKPERGGDQ